MILTPVSAHLMDAQVRANLRAHVAAGVATAKTDRNALRMAAVA